MKLSVLYRGALSSCNYACPYCPFAKHHETDEEHAHDAQQLSRFMDWCERFEGELSVFFTPWGEALTQRRYQQALTRLTHLGHVRRAAVQTNLSAGLQWLDEVDARKLGVWATFHPGQVERARFVRQCLELHRRGISFSVGVVGQLDAAPHLEALRAELPASVYVWVNAVKALAKDYPASLRETFTRIDPLFPLNEAPHASEGRACAGGHTVISVDGDGVARTCHFIREPIGNVYDADFTKALRPRPCTAKTCGCHIGYVHLQHLGLTRVFGDGILERVPEQNVAQRPP